MAFITISSLAISVGSALKKELFQLIKDNFDDHETRINNVESASSKIDIFDVTVSNKSLTPNTTSILYFTADDPMTITSCHIQMFAKGSLTGILEIDVKKSTTDSNPASFTTIFTTKPSLNFSTATDYSKSINQVFDATKVNLSAGDILKIDITSIPSGGVLDSFLINMYGE